jgi:hypothetical protein
MPTSLPAGFLRLENLAVVVAAVALYFDGDYAGWAFFALPPRARPRHCRLRSGPEGGRCDLHLAHTYAFPVGLTAGCLLTGEAGLPVQIALIWAAHIGIDRVLGLGLKYPTGFKDTHLNRV